MTARCPRCSAAVDFSAVAADGRVPCPGCRTRLKLPPALPAAAGPFDFDEPDAVAVADPPAAQPVAPVFVPIPVPAEPPEYVREKVEDLRDQREGRRERREFDREDRVSNPVGLGGVALTGTALLLVLSGLLFSTALPVYSWFAAFLGLMLTLGGLPLSIVGALRPGRARGFAVAGAAAGGLLLLVLIPALMMLLSAKK